MKEIISRRAFLGGAAAGSVSLAASARAANVQNEYDPVPLDRPLEIDELNTPALLLDVATMEDNLKKMAAYARSAHVGLRPHAKTHKCPIVAKRQLEHGAVGICTAKVSEAEVMVDAGIDDVLITSPVVTPEKIARVIDLAQKSDRLKIVVDNAENVDDFNRAAGEAGIVLNVIVDLDTGTRRTGIALGQPALDLVQRINKCRSLRFGGLQAYAGHVMHVVGFEERMQRSRETMLRALETKALIERAGIAVEIFSGGGTGTYDIDSRLEGMTDLQTGSYPFMDVQYREIGDADGPVFDYFHPSLFVLVTAISQPVPELITVDAGYKAFASESVLPEFRDVSGLVYHWAGDEHGIVELKNPSREVKLGDKLAMIASHCDPTVNLYDYYHPYRDGRVTELWPIAARGRSQ